MIRLLALTAVLALAPSAHAAAAAPAKTESKETKPEAKPAEAAPAAPAAPATPAPSADVAEKVEREQLKREVLDEVKRALDKQKEEVRDEVRAQVATQSANRALEEEFQFHEEKKKLELFELNGYFRVRPELFHQFDMRRGADPMGFHLFPLPLQNPQGKTLADANMRWRLEPTLNVSEDVRIHAQIDLLDNVILGSTPDGGFGLSDRTIWVADGNNANQVPPTAGTNWIRDSIQIRRAYGEVNTPVGQLLFGRMGSQWGMGILRNSGNGIDSDYGDTVDRFMFVAKVADHYIVPMIDFVAEGPSSAQRAQMMGQPFDGEQLDDATDYSLAIARRDSDLEITRKLAAGQYILNYGAYFTYRRQSTDADAYYRQNLENFDPQATGGFLPRDAQLYIPDIWLKFQTKKLKLEARDGRRVRQDRQRGLADGRRPGDERRADDAPVGRRADRQLPDPGRAGRGRRGGLRLRRPCPGHGQQAGPWPDAGRQHRRRPVLLHQLQG
ncbi:MAG: TIGR04551 family protein [Myxococcales bacterium]